MNFFVVVLFCFVVFFLIDTLCDPPCLRGQFCDEISGRCVCDDTRRDVQRCYERAGTSFNCLYQVII